MYLSKLCIGIFQISINILHNCLDISVNLLTMHALSKGKITVFSGAQIRPNIHINDISDLYIQLINYK